MMNGEKKGERPGAEEKYKALVETAADAIFTLDLLGRLTFMNPAGERISGYSEEELLGKHFRELLPAKHIPACLNVFQKALRGQPTPPLKIEMITKQGDRVPLELLGRPVKRGRRVVEIIAIARDITERKRAEEALRIKEGAIASSINAIALADLKGNLTYVNDAFLKLWGHDDEKGVLGKPAVEFWQMEEKASEVVEALRDRGGWTGELVAMREDGSLFDVQLSASMVADEVGEPVCMMASFVDITERKRAEEEITRLAKFPSENPNPVLRVAKDGTILYANKASLPLLNVWGCQIGQLLPDDWRKFTSDALTSGSRKEAEAEYDDHILSLTFAPVVDAEYVNVYGLDITERKRAEEEIRRRSKELAALHHVSLDMTAQLDLDTLLKTILLRAQGLLRANAGGLYLYDPERQDLELIVGHGLSKDYTGTRLALGAGACGKVAQSAEPLVVTDYANWEDRSPHFADEPTFNILAIPVKRGDTLLGALYVNDYDLERSFEEEDIRLATLFASQAAIAIENARLFEVTKSQLAQLTALQETTGAVASTLELDKLLHLITQQATTLLQGEGGILNLVDWEKNEDEVVASSGSAAHTPGYRSPLEGSLSGWVTLHNQPVISNQLQNDSRADRRPRSWLVEGMKEQTQSVAIAPLTIKDQAIGTLVIMDKQGRKGEFDQTDLDLLAAFANQAATAIENARLYDKTQTHLKAMTTLQRVGMEITSSLDLSTLLQGIADSTLELTNADYVHLFALDPNTGEFNQRAASWWPEAKKPPITWPRRNKGLTAAVLKAQEPVIIEKATDHPLYSSPETRKWEVKSVAGFPLKGKWGVNGVLNMIFLQPHTFGEDELDLLALLADQAAIAIENARLYEEEQKRLKEITALHKVSEIINATLDLKEIFQRVVEELFETFGYRLVDIYLLEEEGLRLQAQVGYDAETTIDFTPLECGVVGRVARTGQPAFITDVSQDPEYIPTYPEIKSEICVPVKSGQTLLGTLNVESDAKRPLTNDDLQLLSTLSSHIGVAIENARLYQEVQARRVYLETLQRINATLRSTLPLREVLDTIARAATEALGYVGSFIAIPDATGECLTLGAAWGGRIVDAALKVTRFKLESFSVPVKVQENLIARAFVSGELQAATGNPEALAVGTEPSISGKMASAIERISGTKGTACVPLRVGEKSVGVLIIVSPREQLADDERAMLLGLADQAGLAIQNARLYEETQQLAITDGLTGLYNSRYFYEALEKEIQRSERYHRSVSLIILDIDNFKGYNDTHGHLAGDDLLKKLAQLMSGVIRQTDTLARYGGEEFVIILPETETEGAGFLAGRLQEEVREHRFSIQDDQTIGRITISLGVATHPHHADSAKALVDTADRALLRAKQAGKNRLSVYGEELIELKPL